MDTYQTFTSSCLLALACHHHRLQVHQIQGCFCCSCCLFQAASFSKRAFFLASSVSGLEQHSELVSSMISLSAERHCIYSTQKSGLLCVSW